MSSFLIILQVTKTTIDCHRNPNAFVRREIANQFEDKLKPLFVFLDLR